MTQVTQINWKTAWILPNPPYGMIQGANELSDLADAESIRFWVGGSPCPHALKWLSLKQTKYIFLFRWSTLCRIVQNSSLRKSLILPAIKICSFDLSDFRIAQKRKRNSWKKRKSSFRRAIRNRRSIWYQSGVMGAFWGILESEVWKWLLADNQFSVGWRKRGNDILGLPAWIHRSGISLDQANWYFESERGKNWGKKFSWSNP